jgi:hypothetical protein
LQITGVLEPMVVMQTGGGGAGKDWKFDKQWRMDNVL